MKAITSVVIAELNRIDSQLSPDKERLYMDYTEDKIKRVFQIILGVCCCAGA